MPLQATSGAASYDAFGGGVAAVPNYIEDVFSTYLYTGNSPSTQTITNGIDLATYGGMVWCKSRNYTYNHCVMDTARGNSAGNILFTNSTLAQQSAPNAGISSYNSNGFSLRYDDGWGTNEPAGSNIASWTFRKQPKFFDVLTYTGNGTAGTAISHSLGSTPGFILVKRTDTGGSTGQNWVVWHRSAGGTGYFNSTNALDSSFPNSIFWGNGSSYVAPTSTTFTVTDSQNVNASGGSYVAYLFAHDAGGFGLAGTDNVISCGSYTGNGSSSGPTITLGYEPQWVMVKRTDSTSNWFMLDIMRGIPNTPGVAAGSAYLFANTSAAEDSAFAPFAALSATGFSLLTSNSNLNASGGTFIYIAIRRGPMKVPTSGTSVYETVTSSATAGTVLTTGFPVDLQMQAFRSTTGAHRFMDRLRGVSTNSTAGSISLASTSTAAETSTGSYSLAWNNTGFQMTAAFESTSGVFWNFKRAPSFFDEVCYTGTGNNNTSITHNLAVVPELIIVKDRSAVIDWGVYHQAIGQAYAIYLNQSSAAAYVGDFWGTTAFTSTTFRVGNYSALNTNTENYVAYLFATCAGVSKVGSYTGTATTLQVDCGFTGGARFVLIKRTDSTGDWYVWDSARGIVAGNDPYLLLNSTAAEVTSTDYIDTYSAGFEISSTAPAAINASGGTFIFLAIA